MTTTELRREVKRKIDALPAKKLKEAARFLARLDDGGDEETRELLRIPGLLEDLAQARKESAAGKGTPWRNLRRKYKLNV